MRSQCAFVFLALTLAASFATPAYQSACATGSLKFDDHFQYICTSTDVWQQARISPLPAKCASNPCKNGGTCTNTVDAYSCTCKAGFTGIFCDTGRWFYVRCYLYLPITVYSNITEIDECGSEPCKNGGRCSDGLNEYFCDCSGTGFEGPICNSGMDSFYRFCVNKC